MRATQFILASALIGLFSQALLADTIVFQAGVIDGFAAPEDPASPSSNLVTAYLAAGGFAFTGFDVTGGLNGGTPNTTVGHTFSGLPGNIVGATLEARVRAGDSGGTSTDGIELAFTDSTSGTWSNNYLVYLRFFAPFGGDPGLISPSWNAGDDATILLDLMALPIAGGGTLNLLPQLNAHGFLDVVISDDSATDYMTLTLETAPAPEPGGLLLAVLGIAGTGAARWRRRVFRRFRLPSGVI